jgi:hypothetical protein
LLGPEAEEAMLVRLLGFITLGCGCVIGRYRDLGTNREVAYVEDKGEGCASHAHRRNHAVSLRRRSAVPPAFRRARVA